MKKCGIDSSRGLSNLHPRSYQWIIFSNPQPQSPRSRKSIKFFTKTYRSQTKNFLHTHDPDMPKNSTNWPANLAILNYDEAMNLSGWRWTIQQRDNSTPTFQCLPYPLVDSFCFSGYELVCCPCDHFLLLKALHPMEFWPLWVLWSPKQSTACNHTHWSLVYIRNSEYCKSFM